MKNGYHQCRMIALKSLLCAHVLTHPLESAQAEVDEVTSELSVWIRAGGPSVKSEIGPFVQKIQEQIPKSVSYQILICTNTNDIILEELDTMTKINSKVKIVFSNLQSFSTALTSLAKNTDPDLDVLSLSVGVDIRKDQIKNGLSSLKGRVKVYGWKVIPLGNDGSVPGKGWYNTAVLIDKTIVKQIREEGVPKWVDNGVLGKIHQITIGGGEEVPIMVKAIEKDPDAQFVLNVSNPVTMYVQRGTDVNFQEKMERKVIVGEYYMRKLYKESGAQIGFDNWKERIWKSLQVI